MHLVTTAETRFWKENTNLLFLGEWCNTYENGKQTDKRNYEVLPYHWDDRRKLYGDYLYLDSLYEKTLLQLRKLLNQLHGVDYSLRYWRIIVGPWLYCFIQILYDRYLSIQCAFKSGKVTSTYICSYSISDWLPDNFSVFHRWIVGDPYNHFIYSRIIELSGIIPYEGVSCDEGGKQAINAVTNHPKKSVIKFLKKLSTIYGLLLPGKLNKILFIYSHLDFFDLTKIHLAIKQIPYFNPPDIKLNNITVDKEIRSKFCLNKPSNDFEKILYTLISEQIPLNYIEGYKLMNKRSLRFYPEHPTIIFSANVNNTNDSFKFWSAYHTERGTKLYGTQHGGHYGTGLWSSTTAHEIKICDKFYSWGWTSNKQKKIIPLSAAYFNKLKRVTPSHSGKILLILTGIPRYSYHLFSIPVAASGGLSYLKEQYRFVNALSVGMRKQLVVRLDKQDYGWSQYERWKDEIPNVECYNGSMTIYEQLKQSRLAVCTHNATTVLETLAANFPTIIFWNTSQWELSEYSKPLFEKLQIAGIFHQTPEAAADKVKAIHEDVATWWKQPEVQNARNAFCCSFARNSDSWINEWKSELTTY